MQLKILALARAKKRAAREHARSRVPACEIFCIITQVRDRCHANASIATKHRPSDGA
jgi:hypothetical protein